MYSGEEMETQSQLANFDSMANVHKPVNRDSIRAQNEVEQFQEKILHQIISGRSPWFNLSAVGISTTSSKSYVREVGGGERGGHVPNGKCTQQLSRKYFRTRNLSTHEKTNVKPP